uniref:NADH-ubiquinone oxidoreductase chain 1 n=1 Tax=Paraspadella gotoi TaxID=34758 RepID=Q6E0W1_PARGO|nr:NADH dehydrogenase subunit 1 [Paraspadella gotoi]AAT12171.1 NADH dehydrogenase subunit 1 [Paraspadella gotoi]
MLSFFFAESMFNLVLNIIIILIGVAFFTLMERKILSLIQLRVGPNKPSYMGLLVPFADALKLITKENNIPQGSNKLLYLLLPLFTLMIPLNMWVLNPSNMSSLTTKSGLLFFLCLSSLGVYAIMFLGWSSNSKYSLMGAIRSVAQTISYEVTMAIIIIHHVIINMYMLKNLGVTPTNFFIIIMVMMMISMLAESNRAPFDFAEGESELVSGFNTEFSSIPFVLIFLAEYTMMFFMSLLCSLLFFSTHLYMFFFLLMVFFFIWARGTLPRFRYDQLMMMAWKSLLPLVLGSLLLITST